MIPVAPAPEPPGFAENVRDKGQKWIAERRWPITELPNYWCWCEGHLYDAFRGRCGWTAMAITSGQVDHFVLSQSQCINRNLPEQAYEWGNYRYIMPELNSKKGRRPPVLDPFVVQPGWFEIVLPSLFLRVTNMVPDSRRELALATLRDDGLGLERGPKLMRLRRKYLQQYKDAKTTIAFLDDDFPLLADALRKLFAAADVDLSQELRHWRAELIAARRAAGASTP